MIGYCVDPRSAEELQEGAATFCTRDQILAEGRLREAADVPITPGRDLIEPTQWNAWTTVTGLFVDDERYGRDFRTLSGTAAFGADRKLTDALVAGVSVTFEAAETDGFNSTLEVDTQGVEIGPYVAMRLSEHWAGGRNPELWIFQQPVWHFRLERRLSDP
ncbi:autotransporter outer membrane beta-barrel domain-containing protein [Rhodobacterales bacterium]|nr:autotransporter outer membrane beta-barrel domain-containing protein [Rhodobacterales bacterium]